MKNAATTITHTDASVGAATLASLSSSTLSVKPSVTVRMTQAPGAKRKASQMLDGEPVDAGARSAPVPTTTLPSGPDVHPSMKAFAPNQRQKISRALQLLLEAQRHRDLCMQLSALRTSRLAEMVAALSDVPNDATLKNTLHTMINTHVHTSEDSLLTHAMMLGKQTPDGPLFFYTNSVATAMNDTTRV